VQLRTAILLRTATLLRTAVAIELARAAFGMAAIVERVRARLEALGLPAGQKIRRERCFAKLVVRAGVGSHVCI